MVFKAGPVWLPKGPNESFLSKNVRVKVKRRLKKKRNDTNFGEIKKKIKTAKEPAPWHDGMPVITMDTGLPHEIEAKCQPVRQSSRPVRRKR